MLGYADYVFTGTFAFEIVLKVTRSTGVCFRGLLLCVTHSQDVWRAFGPFQFLSSVIKLHFFFNQRIFFCNHSTWFCCFFLTFECMGELLWLPNSNWKFLFAPFFLYPLNLSTGNRYNTMCELSSTLPDVKVRGKAFISSTKGMSLFSFLWLHFQCPKIVTHYFLARGYLQDSVGLFVLRYFISVLRYFNGWAYICSTRRAPFGQGFRNVLPMHELRVAIAACGLCTGCEGHLGVSSFQCTLRSGDPQQRAQNPQTC